MILFLGSDRGREEEVVEELVLFWTTSYRSIYSTVLHEEVCVCDQYK